MGNRLSSKSMSVLIFSAICLIACDSQIAQPDLSDQVLQNRSETADLMRATNLTADINKDLAAVRRATAKYHRYDVAVEDGFIPLSECVEVPGLGGMGYHYGLPSRIDGSIEVEYPQVVMYEPDKNGKMHLIGVEYIIPFDFLPADEEPPVLYGQEFSANQMLGLWALHVWVWKHNPNGIFDDWNPNVSCQFAQDHS
jgi:hypothetical protein